MTYSKRLKGAVTILGIAAISTLATAAIASPGSGISSAILVTANLDEEGQFNSDRVKLQTKDKTNVRVQRLTFAAGAYSGWHHHPGVIIVAVQSGIVTLSDSNCGSKNYGPGQPNGAVFIEGHDNAMEARSAGGAVVYVTYVVPAASPPVFREEDGVPSCAL